MAYYDLLISAWNNPTQPPPGVTGTGLTAGMPTATKLANVNAWTVTGAIPTTIYVTGDQVFNCVNYTEFKALTAAQQSNLLMMLNTPGLLLGGSGNTTHLLVGMILDVFTVGGATIAALTALAKAATQPWWQANGYPRPFDMGDVAAAGLS